MLLDNWFHMLRLRRYQRSPVQYLLAGKKKVLLKATVVEEDTTYMCMIVKGHIPYKVTGI